MSRKDYTKESDKSNIAQRVLAHEGICHLYQIGEYFQECVEAHEDWIKKVKKFEDWVWNESPISFKEQTGEEIYRSMGCGRR